MESPWRGWAAACFALALAWTPAAAQEPGSSEITLEWTAPGDDGRVGAANHYDIRYSTSELTEDNFYYAARAAGVPRPSGAGTHQRITVTGLEANRRYYFALRTSDESGNWSPMSNVVSMRAPDPLTHPQRFAIAMSAPHPSPARDHVQFEMTLPREGLVHVKVIDAGGRVVKTLAYGHYPAGVSVRRWELADERGVRLRPGQYWLLGVLGETTVTRPLTVVP